MSIHFKTNRFQQAYSPEINDNHLEVVTSRSALLSCLYSADNEMAEHHRAH